MRLVFYFLSILVVSIVAYDFPGRLTSDEAVELQGTCGRKPKKIDFTITSPQQKSAYSTVTNRTAAPWAVELWCSGVLISKRHVLTAAHCVAKQMKDCGVWCADKSINGDTLFGTSCTGGRWCPKKEMLHTIKISHFFFHEIWLMEGYPQELNRDFAILVLEEDLPFSDILYPACLGGYAADINDTFEQFGYGSSSDEEIRETGVDRLWHLQTYRGKKSSRNGYYDNAKIVGFDPSPHSDPRGGDSGSGYIHTRDGVHSVYSILAGSVGGVRVSSNLFWISKATGIDVADEDNEFDGYFYPLVYKDHRNKKTYEVGARHPNKIIPDGSTVTEAIDRLSNEKLCPGNVFVEPQLNGTDVHIFHRCNAFSNYFQLCEGEGIRSNKHCQLKAPSNSTIEFVNFVTNIFDIPKPTTIRNLEISKLSQEYYTNVTNI